MESDETVHDGAVEDGTIVTADDLEEENDSLTRTIMNLMSVIQDHQKSIEILSAKVSSDGEAIGQLSELVTFLLQNQQEISARVGLTESSKRSKLTRNVVTSSDGDLPN